MKFFRMPARREALENRVVRRIAKTFYRLIAPKGMRNWFFGSRYGFSPGRARARANVIYRVFFIYFPQNTDFFAACGGLPKRFSQAPWCGTRKSLRPSPLSLILRLPCSFINLIIIPWVSTKNYTRRIDGSLSSRARLHSYSKFVRMNNIIF